MTDNFFTLGIGKGKEFILDELDTEAIYNCKLMTSDGPIEVNGQTNSRLLRPEKFSPIDIKSHGSERMVNITESGDNDFEQFRCNNNVCTATFPTHAGLMEHLSSNVCYVTERRSESWMDTGRRKYFNRQLVDKSCQALAFTSESLPEVEIPNSLLPLGYVPEDNFDERHMGFAQKAERSHEVFDEDVKVSLEIPWPRLNFCD